MTTCVSCTQVGIWKEKYDMCNSVVAMCIFMIDNCVSYSAMPGFMVGVVNFTLFSFHMKCSEQKRPNSSICYIIVKMGIHLANE